MSDPTEITEGSVMIVGGRGGRPRAAEPGLRVSFWLPESDYDRLYRLADLHGVSISHFVARAVQRTVNRSIE